MNKAELIDVLTQNLGTDRRQATAALENFVDTIVRAVHTGESVSITGFGVFEQRRRAARVARNPRTGETVKKKPIVVPVFRPGAQFKAVVSGAQRLPARGPALGGRSGAEKSDTPEAQDTPDATPRSARNPRGARNPEVHDALSAIEEINRPRTTRLPKRLTAAQNRAIEQHAVDLVRQHFEAQGYVTTDVGATESYDVHAVRSDQMIKIEVKGTTSDGCEIVLTYNEVELHMAEYPNNALAVVKHIKLDQTGPTASGGELELVLPWNVERERLRPIAYRYPLGN
jgi:DNA-binding protein HU-beta